MNAAKLENLFGPKTRKYILPAALCLVGGVFGYLAGNSGNGRYQMNGYLVFDTRTGQVTVFRPNENSIAPPLNSIPVKDAFGGVPVDDSSPTKNK